MGASEKEGKRKDQNITRNGVTASVFRLALKASKGRIISLNSKVQCDINQGCSDKTQGKYDIDALSKSVAKM